MKFIPFLLITFMLIVISCSKDKFTTIPQVNINSITPTTVFAGDIISLKATYTDDEGDIDSIFVVRKFYNGATATQVDTIERFEFAILGVPSKTRKAEIEVAYEYHTNNNPDYRFIQGVSKDTTAGFGLLLKDKAANKSDYKESESIRLKKP